MVLHCNTISHWLGTYTEWSLPKYTIRSNGWWSETCCTFPTRKAITWQKCRCRDIKIASDIRVLFRYVWFHRKPIKGRLFFFQFLYMSHVFVICDEPSACPTKTIKFLLNLLNVFCNLKENIPHTKQSMHMHRLFCSVGVKKTVRVR